LYKEGLANIRVMYRTATLAMSVRFAR